MYYRDFSSFLGDGAYATVTLNPEGRFNQVMLTTGHHLEKMADNTIFLGPAELKALQALLINPQEEGKEVE